MSQGLSFFHLMIGHQREQLVFVGSTECSCAVGPCVARDDSLGVRKGQNHLVDDLRLDLVAEVVVGYVQAHV